MPRPSLGSSTVILSGSITNTMLRPSAAYSVIGRSYSGGGTPADIIASANRTLLARQSNLVGFVPYEDIFDPAKDPFLAASRTGEPKCCVYNLVSDPIHAGLAADHNRAAVYDAVTDPFAGALRG